jgi:hypothetical protein
MMENLNKTYALTNFLKSGFLQASLFMAKNEFSAINTTIVIQCFYRDFRRNRGLDDQLHTRISHWSGLSVALHYSPRMNWFR